MNKLLTRTCNWAWLFTVALSSGATAWARNDPFDIGAPAAPEPKAFVPQYFIVGMLIALGLFLVCKPAKRDPEIPHEFQVSGADKDVKNL